jgi:hypothetical protein
MSAQVLYGPYNMNSQKCAVSVADIRSLPKNLIGREQVARRHGTLQINHDYSEKTVQMTGRLKRPSGHVPTFREIQDEFDNAMSKNMRYLRIARTRTVISDADDITGWSIADDAVNVTADTSTYQVSDCSISFDVDVSASANDYATVSNSSISPVDLSAVSESGSVEFWVFLPDITHITSLDFRWGADATNYWYQNTITTNYEGRPLEPGWNYISVYWPTASESGVPTAAAISYLFTRVNYTASMIDTTGILINGFAWMDEDNCENYTATVETVDMEEEPGNIDWQPFTVSMLCNNPFAYSTHDSVALERDTQTSVSKAIDITLEGSFAPSPLITYTINTPEGLSGVQYSNVTTQESISVSTAWTAGDTLNIDTETMVCYLNGMTIDYDGVFPRHVLGFNKVRTVITSATKATVSQLLQGGCIYLYDTTIKVAQSFDPTATGTLISVSIGLSKMRNESLSVGVYLYSDSGGSPSAVLSYLGTIPVTSSDIPLNSLYPFHTLSSNYAVSNATTYWIVLQDPRVFSGSEVLVGIKPGNVYAGGSTKILYPGMTTWTAVTQLGVGVDFRFQVETQPAFSANYDWDINYRKRFI